MNDPIVHSLAPIALVGGGEASPEDLQEVLTLCDGCVAADGGAALALAAGVTLDALIGDFDSVSDAARAAVPTARQHHIAEQDSTDFEKALSRIDAPVILGVGFLGGRLDHQMAALHALLRYPDRPCVLLGQHELTFLAPPRIALPTRPGDLISLFPMAPVMGQSSGLRWPIEGLAFDPLRKIGTSNSATGPCEIAMQAPKMMVMVPRRLIQPVVSALSHSDALRWPAPAE